MKWMQRLRGFGAICVVVGVVAECSLVGHAAPTWSVVAGHMSAARELPAAIVLNDGRVLVVGGVSPGVLPTSVDVYDPSTNRWAKPAASMHTGRWLFAATLLKNGQVLVAGGFTVDYTVDPPQPRFLASTEIYDPAHDTWTDGPDLPSANFAARAITLGDGRVLLVGGLTMDGLASSAALYYEGADPAIATWTAGPPMLSARELPDATMLSDGRVLVSGGFASGGNQPSVASAELFDPVANSWSSAGQLPMGRPGHTVGLATRLQDGRVLVVGGADANANPTILATADIYDPKANSWSPAGSMSIARVFFAGGLLADGSVIVAGGLDLDPAYNLFQSSELYDSKQDIWTLTPQSMSAPRGALAGAIVSDGDRFFVTGGLANRDSFTILDTGEVYTLNRPPIAVASANPPMTQGVPGSLAAVTLSAVGSSDPENDRLTFTWTESGSTLTTTVDPTRTAIAGLAIGVHHITLTADDGFGGISTATVDVTVLDATEPFQVQIAALASQNDALTTLNQQLQERLAASQRAIADAVTAIQTNLRVSFRDPSFTIPGGTPQAQLQAVTRAIVQLSRECRRDLYEELRGKRARSGREE